MSAIGQPQNLDTGFNAIDCVAYRLSPATLSIATAHIHFSWVFRKARGFSPYRYAWERRLLKLQRMRMACESAVQDIVASCGFPCHANFSAAFARARGMSPSEYRARFAL